MWFVTRPRHAKNCDMGLYHDMTCKYQGLTRTGYLWGGGERPVNKTLSVVAWYGQKGKRTFCNFIGGQFWKCQHLLKNETDAFNEIADVQLKR